MVKSRLAEFLQSPEGRATSREIIECLRLLKMFTKLSGAPRRDIIDLASNARSADCELAQHLCDMVLLHCLHTRAQTEFDVRRQQRNLRRRFSRGNAGQNVELAGGR